jgi:hypothetical protein
MPWLAVWLKVVGGAEASPPVQKPPLQHPGGRWMQVFEILTWKAEVQPLTDLYLQDSARKVEVQPSTDLYL